MTSTADQSFVSREILQKKENKIKTTPDKIINNDNNT